MGNSALSPPVCGIRLILVQINVPSSVFTRDARILLSIAALWISSIVENVEEFLVKHCQTYLKRCSNFLKVLTIDIDIISGVLHRI